MLGGSVIFLEEELRSGGFGMNLSHALREAGFLSDVRYNVMGTENGFLTQKKGQTPLQAAGLDADAVVRAAKDLTEKEN